MEQIKVGDKVRIANNAPSVYRYGFNYRLRTQESEVVELDDDGYIAAIVPMCVNGKDLWFQIPTKYLIKVDAEAKEPKFKKGDKACINELSLKHGLRGEILTIIGVDVSDKTYLVQSICMRSPIWLREDEISLYTAPTIKVGDRVCCYNVLHLKGSKKEDYMGIVTSITDMGIMVQLDNGGAMLSYHESDLELVQPKEQTEVEKKPNVGSIKIPVEVDLSDSYWDAYTADLAKEIVLKKINSASDQRPSAIGAYAVSVAKSVVENLKKKEE